mmetsp:Transcript_56555/g.138986  ORF Transcript_56555/g.138986 Transcript_56555/m.138986 type:complete len:222 (-) Transcript_56555:251-916(-)
MHDVHQNLKTEIVGGINESLEVFGCSAAGTASEEVCHMVPERCVVRVFHDGHDLNSCVSKLLDARENVVGKLLIGINAWLDPTHANVALINAETVGAWQVIGVLPAVGPLGLRVPKLGVVEEGLWILDAEGAPCGVAIEMHTTLGNHTDLDLGGMRDRAGSVLLVGNEETPDPEIATFHGVLVAIPAAKLAKEVHLLRTRGPLGIANASLFNLHAELLIPS